MPTALVGIKIAQPDAFLAKLRGLPMPIIARIEDDRVLFDPRTVLPEQEAHFLRQIQEI